MFHFDSNLVQVEMGNNALKIFSTKDTRGFWEILMGEAPPGWADDLIRVTSDLRKKLEAEGIILPPVMLSPASELPPDMFCITFGVEREDFNVRKDNYVTALEKMARIYHFPDLKKDVVSELLNKALNLVLQKNYHDAMERLMKVYYLSSLIEYQTVRIVSLLNMAGICILNNKPGEAYTAARQAQLLVEKDGFYDPYLKYYTHKAIANVAALYNEYNDSAMLFEQAFQDIEYTGEANLIVDTLYNEASVLLRAGSYKKCTGVLDKILSFIEKSDCYEKKILITLYKMRSFIADRTEESLQNKLADIQQEYNYLSSNFLLKAMDTGLTIVSKCGPYILTTCAGALISGDKYYNQSTNITQNSANGTNIIGRSITVK